MTATYTLADGREVDASGPLATFEREALALQLTQLRSTRGTDLRRIYLDAVERSMGRAYRDRLAKLYADDWTQRKGGRE